MTEDQLVESVFASEGVRYGDQHTVPPIDQPTGAGGITLPTMTAYLGRQATAADLKALTKATATPVVRWKLRELAARYRLSAIAFEPLRLQMIDFAYNSGPGLAIRWLQRTLRVAPVDGAFGPASQAALAAQDPWLVNQALIAARLQMVDEWTDASKQAKAWEEGVESRGLLFSLL